jgi:hypothetical protein
MKITPIKNEDDLIRDLESNAVLFKNPDSGLEKRNRVFKNAFEDINNLKEEVSEMKNSLKQILEILSKGSN